MVNANNRNLREREIVADQIVSARDDGETRKKRAARSVTVNVAESPLSWLYARGHLTARQFDAGEKLRHDYEAAQLSPSLTMRWDAAPISKAARGSSGHLEASERSLSAKQRFDQALSALGQDLNDIAWRVICAGESISGAEKQMGWPSRSGKLVLRLALDRLAYFYRIPGE